MTDFILVLWVSLLIEITRLQWMMGGGTRWQPGEKLKLLFAGYNGTRNTGSDVRVNEMLRQIRHVLGAENVDFGVMTQNFDRTKGYFAGTQQVFLPDVFPPFLYRETRKNHGVMACEGSMFKSKFANALTTMMIARSAWPPQKINCPSATAPKPATWTNLSQTCARASFTIRWSSPAIPNRKPSSESSASPPN